MPGPAPAVLARWAVKYGPLALPYLRKAYAQGRHRQLAILHARTLVDGTFSWEMHGGRRVWVVWTGDTVVATYPELPEHAPDDPFPGARTDRRQRPDDVVVQRVRQRVLGGRGTAPRAEVEASAERRTLRDRLRRRDGEDAADAPVDLADLPPPDHRG